VGEIFGNEIFKFGYYILQGQCLGVVTSFEFFQHALKFCGDDFRSVMYGIDDGSGWALETVMGNSINSSLDLVASASGEAHLVFEDDGGQLIYATNLVPEPTAGVLMVAAAFTVLMRRRRPVHRGA
jgi:hypothetical protein